MHVSDSLYVIKKKTIFSQLPVLWLFSVMRAYVFLGSALPPLRCYVKRKAAS